MTLFDCLRERRAGALGILALLAFSGGMERAAGQEHQRD